MISPLYIHHVTLQTGHVRRSERAGVSDEALDACGRLVATPGLVRIHAVDGYGLLVHDPVGRCLTASVHQSRSLILGDVSPPLATIGIATRSRCGSALWRRLHDGRPELATSADAVPPTPWCAARLEPALADDPDAAHWLGDLERCLAWAHVLRHL